MAGCFVFVVLLLPCVVAQICLFRAVVWVAFGSVIVPFADHTHFHFYY